ncbi:MAG: histidine phosphatase family protein [Clostridia bacterium]|nr:histidine phosphatase family protein [Clostridia bacterium]
MRIIFVRHGNPNYELDCLTELGHVQAESAAERLKGEGIEAIFSSTCGRALETAAHTAEKIGISITPCDFMREIDWTSKDGTPVFQNGHPWYYADEYICAGKCLNDVDWQNDPLYSKTKTPASVEAVGRGLDEWLVGLGYEREGYYYKVREEKYKTVAMFCHGGSFAAAVTHLLNLPMPLVLLLIPLQQTGIFELELTGEQGSLITPRLYKANGTRHLLNDNIKVT